MAVEVERLLVSLEARINKFERDFNRAADQSRRVTRKIEQDSERMAARVKASFAAAGASAAASFKAGFVGLATGAIGAVSIEGVTKSIADLAKLQDVAERTGVSTKKLQEFGYAVQQSGGEVDDVGNGLQKFAVNLSKAGQGGGDLAKILEANNVALRDQSGVLRPVGDLLGEVADLIANATSEEDKLNIASAAFGRSAGPGLVLALSNGRKGLEDFATQARAAGVVLDDELIKKAAALDDELAKLSSQLKGIGDQLAVEFAGPAVVAGMQGFLDMLREARFTIDAIKKGNLQDALPFFNNTPAGRAGLAGRNMRGGFGTSSLSPDEIKKFYDRTGAGSAGDHPEVTISRPTVMPGKGEGGDSKLKGLQGEFSDALAGFIAAARAAGHDIAINSGKRSVERQAELFAAAVKKYGSVDAARKWVAPPGSSFHNKGTAADLGYSSGGARAWAHRNASAFGLTFPMGHEPWHIEPEGQRGRAGGALTAAQEKAEDAARDRNNAYSDLLKDSDARIAGRQREAEALNQTAYARAFAAEKARLLADIEKEEIVASPEKLAALDAQAARYANMTVAAENLERATDAVKEAQRELGELGADAVKGFVADLRAGKSAADALGNAIDRILTKVTDNLIDSLFSMMFKPSSGGGGGGILGAIGSALGFGGARAGGGPVEAGKAYLVGEKRPELFVPRVSGSIIARVPSAAASASRQQVVTVVRVEASPYFDATVDNRATSVARPMAAQAGVQAVAASDKRGPMNQARMQRHGRI